MVGIRIVPPTQAASFFLCNVSAPPVKEAVLPRSQEMYPEQMKTSVPPPVYCCSALSYKSESTKKLVFLQALEFIPGSIILPEVVQRQPVMELFQASRKRAILMPPPL